MNERETPAGFDSRTPQQLAVEQQVRAAAEAVGLRAELYAGPFDHGTIRPAGWQIVDANGACVAGSGHTLTAGEAIYFCSRQ